MAEFMGTIQGSKGKASQLGGKSSGLQTTCNGWCKGVKVVARYINGKDVFRVYETGGSDDSTKRLIAVIR